MNFEYTCKIAYEMIKICTVQCKPEIQFPSEKNRWQKSPVKIIDGYWKGLPLAVHVLTYPQPCRKFSKLGKNKILACNKSSKVHDDMMELSIVDCST